MAGLNFMEVGSFGQLSKEKKKDRLCSVAPLRSLSNYFLLFYFRGVPIGEKSMEFCGREVGRARYEQFVWYRVWSLSAHVA